MKRIENRYIIQEDYVELILTSNKFGEKVYLIDLDDLEKVKQFHWCVVRMKNKKGEQTEHFYANTNHGKLALHRYIMNCTDSNIYIDHIDRNSFDNRKTNLREATPSQNANNSARRKSKSGMKGITWCYYLTTPKWMANIRYHGKQIHLGYFTDLEEAKRVRREAEIKYFGEYNNYDGIDEILLRG